LNQPDIPTGMTAQQYATAEYLQWRHRVQNMTDAEYAALRTEPKTNSENHRQKGSHA